MTDNELALYILLLFTITHDCPVFSSQHRNHSFILLHNIETILVSKHSPYYCYILYADIKWYRQQRANHIQAQSCRTMPVIFLKFSRESQTIFPWVSLMFSAKTKKLTGKKVDSPENSHEKLLNIIELKKNPTILKTSLFQFRLFLQS